MEQAPPPAPPGGSATPKLYMTPQLAKRRDGLCPSFLGDNSKGPNGGTKAPPGGASKTYRTNSQLLLQVKEEGKDVPREWVELQTLIESVNAALDKIVGPRADIASKEFQPAGCTWRMELDPNLNHGAEKNYRLEVVCLANSAAGITNYVFDTKLVPKVPVVDPDPLAPPLKGYNDAKAAFDVATLAVRKAIVRLEFPEFPEGCKGRPFREVYQLNARVRSG
jgi:hypothetical protein